MLPFLFIFYLSHEMVLSSSYFLAVTEKKNGFANRLHVPGSCWRSPIRYCEKKGKRRKKRRDTKEETNSNREIGVLKKHAVVVNVRYRNSCEQKFQWPVYINYTTNEISRPLWRHISITLFCAMKKESYCSVYSLELLGTYFVDACPICIAVHFYYCTSLSVCTRHQDVLRNLYFQALSLIFVPRLGA